MARNLRGKSSHLTLLWPPFAAREPLVMPAEDILEQMLAHDAEPSKSKPRLVYQRKHQALVFVLHCVPFIHFPTLSLTLPLSWEWRSFPL